MGIVKSIFFSMGLGQIINYLDRQLELIFPYDQQIVSVDTSLLLRIGIINVTTDDNMEFKVRKT